jgi:hypothetical protein
MKKDEFVVRVDLEAIDDSIPGWRFDALRHHYVELKKLWHVDKDGKIKAIDDDRWGEENSASGGKITWNSSDEAPSKVKVSLAIKKVISPPVIIALIGLCSAALAATVGGLVKSILDSDIQESQQQYTLLNGEVEDISSKLKSQTCGSGDGVQRIKTCIEKEKINAVSNAGNTAQMKSALEQIVAENKSVTITWGEPK